MSKKRTIKAIKIVNLSKDNNNFGENDIFEIQKNFFLIDLPSDKHYMEFRCHKHASSVANGSLLLFVYDKQIIASAQLKDIIDYRKSEKTTRNIAEGFNKAYLLELPPYNNKEKSNSIIVFEPITSEELGDIDKSFKRFVQGGNILNYSYYDNIEDLITEKMNSWKREHNIDPVLNINNCCLKKFR